VRYLFTRVSVSADTFRVEQYRRLNSPPEVHVCGLLQLEIYLKNESLPAADMQRIANELRETGYAEYKQSQRRKQG
jgi:hypothetical protein